MKKYSLLLILAIFLSGCARRIGSDSLMRITPGMNKDQVIRKIGYPTVFRGAIVNKFDQTIEVFEYKVDKGKKRSQVIDETLCVICTLGIMLPFVLMTEGEVENYWIYFNNDKLVQWGKAGDWEKEADHIQEVRFKDYSKSLRL